MRVIFGLNFVLLRAYDDKVSIADRSNGNEWKRDMRETNSKHVENIRRNHIFGDEGEREGGGVQ